MSSDLSLMVEALESAYEYSEKVIDGIGGIVYNLHAGREDKALPVCIDLVDGIKWLGECFELTGPYQDAKGIKIDYSKLNEVTVQLVEALENKDYVLLGDLLEYEVVPVVQEWNDQIRQILGGNSDNQ
ncbi:MAG: hypothetical protein N2645_16350 [Clostridia bacterium]|nr:hypothetical protein [Clostridia bacterium]